MFHRLLVKCADYPELYIDWRSNDAKLNAVKNQLDIGIRIGIQAEDLMIVRKICDTTTAYLARHGTPQSLDELTGRFPASSLIDANTNRPWGWPLNAEMHVFQKTSVSSQTTLPTNSPLRWQAALAGCVAAYIPEHLCRTHLQNGKLVELFPEIPRRPWQLYIYCPQRTVTSGRVLKVFDWLTEVLREMYDKEAT